MESVRDRRIQPPKWREILLMLPFAFCYAFFIVLGDWQRSAHYSNARNMGRLALWTVIAWAVLLLLGFLLENGSALAAGVTARLPKNAALPAGVRKVLSVMFLNGGSRRGHWWIWLAFSALCLLCYLPYFLMYYPTWFNNDAIWQMEQALGMAAKSNHHPYFHTLIVKLFLDVGNFLFGNLTAAVALYTFFQMAMTAAVFGFLLFLLYRRGTGIFWLILAMCFYVLLPVNAMLSICMGKDAWFTAAFLLFTWAACVCAQTKAQAEDTANDAVDSGIGQTEGLSGFVGKRKSFRTVDRRWIWFAVTGLAVCLLRSNGIFVFLGTAVFLMVSAWWQEQVARKEGVPASNGKAKQHEGGTDAQSAAKWLRQPMFVATLVVLVLYLIWQGPVLSALQVEPPDTIESLTMPTQHLLCAYKRGGSLTAEEIGVIEQVVPLADIDEYYNPYLFDLTKNYIREHGNQEIIAKNKGAYAKLWLTVGLRNPMLYLEGEIRQTAGYYALHIPHELYLYSDYFMVDNPLGIEGERKLFTYDDSLAMGKFLQDFQELYRRVWSLGANTWLLLAALACALYRKRRIAAYLPAVCLLGSLMLASPVYNEFRYAYGVFAALPFLLEIGFGREENKMSYT